MTTLMIELAPDHASHLLSGLSLIQLEGTLNAASLLLDTWRTNTLSDFHHSSEGPQRLAKNGTHP